MRNDLVLDGIESRYSDSPAARLRLGFQNQEQQNDAYPNFPERFQRQEKAHENGLQIPVPQKPGPHEVTNELIVPDVSSLQIEFPTIEAGCQTEAESPDNNSIEKYYRYVLTCDDF